MFDALPNVCILSLMLPSPLKIDLMKWVEKHGGLRELRSMRIKEHTDPVPSQIFEFLLEVFEVGTVEEVRETGGFVSVGSGRRKGGSREVRW